MPSPLPPDPSPTPPAVSPHLPLSPSPPPPSLPPAVSPHLPISPSPPLPSPPGPGRFIPVDDLHTLRRSPLEAMLALARRYGDLFQYPVGFWTVYVVNHPDLIRHLLQDAQRHYSKDTFQYNLLGAVVGQGLLTNHGDSWLGQRRLMQPAFHRERLAALGAGMVAEATRLATRWEGAAQRGEAMDIAAEMMHLTLAIVGRALFSIDLSNEADALARAVLTTLDQVVYRAQMPFAPPTWLPTPRNRRFVAAQRQLDAAVFQIIAARRRTGTDEGDLLGMLLEARDEETGAGMSDAQVRDELLTLIIAGHETVASALTWTWYLLAQHPTIEQRMAAEVQGTLAGRAPTVADLPALPFTRQVFEETLRLYPPAWLMTRKALRADTLGGYAIPANALLVMSPYVTHRHPAFWEEPEAFNPDRFAPEQVAARPRFAYFPFGGGPHLCIGNHFALMEAQLVLATLAQRFRLVPLPSAPVQVEPLVTLQPKGGLWMRVERQRGRRGEGEKGRNG